MGGAEEALGIRELLYDLGLAEELRGSRELSDAVGHLGTGFGPTLGLIGCRASSEKGGLLFLLVLAIVTLGVDRVFQAAVP